MTSGSQRDTFHPWAWWAWALLIAAATSLTTNPIMLLMLAIAVTVVAFSRRGDSSWARGLWAYYVFAAVIIVVRLVLHILVGVESPRATVLFTLPEVHLPRWLAGIALGGPVGAESLVAATYSALQLGLMVICVGAANALANPRRALRSVPSALYEVSVVIVVGMTLAPQLVTSAVRVRRARRLRGRTSRLSILVPVLADAVDRSLALAAGMEARGFGSTRRAQGRRWSGVLMVTGSAALILGSFFLLSGGSPFSGLHRMHRATLWLLGAGVLLVVAGLWRSGRQLRITRYRPDPWQWNETVVLACGVTVLVVTVWLLRADPAVLMPDTSRLHWPSLPPAFLVAVAAAAAPMVIPAPRHSARPVAVR